MNILDLPETVLVLIFDYLSYDEVARKREVCRRFNELGQQVLNTGFNRVIRLHGRNLRRIKALLPRRESERRNHCLSRHADVLTSVETRISMLSMTYAKYIELDLCCFIPGRVLDEIYRILHLTATSTKQLRPHEVLQELRDISSMAIEHFDECIAVDFKSEHLAKLAEHSRLNSSFGEISFTGLANSSAARWSSVISSAARQSSGMTANTRCCESMIQRLNKILALGGPNTSTKRIQTSSSSYGHDHDHDAPDRLPAENVVTYQDQQDEEEQPAVPRKGFLYQRKTYAAVKRLQKKYESGFAKITRMHQVQLIHARRLREAHTAISELTTQVSELKKQLEDVTTKHKLKADIDLPNETTTTCATSLMVSSSPPTTSIGCSESNAHKRHAVIVETTVESGESDDDDNDEFNDDDIIFLPLGAVPVLNISSASSAAAAAASCEPVPIKKPKV